MKHTPFVWILALLLLQTATAADTPPAPLPGEKMLDAYFRHQVQRITDDCLKDIRTREDWEKRRPELRREFLDMLGLWPLPPRSELKATVTGQFDAGRFIVEKLQFQSQPGLYVTGNLYLPKQGKSLPAVLYVCGHGNVVKDGVSFGSKVFYQHHPAWLASNGYVCLILDTLELGELPGNHHGTSRDGKWGWQALGYTPAGVECWNAMRALDYLQTRPEVDFKRLAVTGRSGGGATSWWVAAADDRVSCIIPVAGIADLQSHLIEGEAAIYKKGGVIAGHCDCMYMVNTYRWDFPAVAALCAPRPLLLGNSDTDAIFPVGGYRRLAEKVSHIYDLYGAGEKFALLETAGPHKDTPELRLGAFRWLNHWLKGDDGPVIEPVREPFVPAQLRVFERLPGGARNHAIDETFVPAAKPELPANAAAWEKQRNEWEKALAEHIFAGWSRDAQLQVTPAADVTHDGLRLRAYEFVSEADVPLRVWLTTAEGLEKPELIMLTSVDEAGWHDWLKELGPNFAPAFPGTTMPARDPARFEQTQKALAFHKWGFATVASRGIGPTRWAKPGSKEDTLIRRRFALIGQTLDGQRLWDVRQALAALRSSKELTGIPIGLQGRGEMAGIVLHAALFERDLGRVDLWHPPTSYRNGPTFLNILRHFDMPQAVAMALPIPVRIYVKDEVEAKAWDWAIQIDRLLGKETLKICPVGD